MKIQVNIAVESKSYQSNIFTIISKDEVIKNLYNAMITTEQTMDIVPPYRRFSCQVYFLFVDIIMCFSFC